MDDIDCYPARPPYPPLLVGGVVGWFCLSSLSISEEGTGYAPVMHCGSADQWESFPLESRIAETDREGSPL